MDEYSDPVAIGKAMRDYDEPAAQSADAMDAKRLQWLIDKEMLFAWPTQWIGGNYSSVRAQGTENVTGIESRDVRAVIDAAISQSAAAAKEYDK